MEFSPVIVQLFSAFMVLFAIIDIFGLVPILIAYKNNNYVIKPANVSALSFVILLVSLIGGEFILGLFGLDISSFAIAGSIVIFLLSLEMTLGISLFKTKGSNKEIIIPIAFPLIAGPGSITTIITLRAEYPMWVLVVALLVNMVVVFLTLSSLDRIAKFLGQTGSYITEKIFGIILMAIAIKIFLTNTGIDIILKK